MEEDVLLQSEAKGQAGLGAYCAYGGGITPLFQELCTG
jgi:hypothetical protein